jgi:hypothetical protein
MRQRLLMFGGYLLLVLTLVAPVGCDGEADDDDDDDDDSGTPGDDDDNDDDDDDVTASFTAEAAFSEVIPTVATVTWTTDEAGSSQVLYGLDEDLSLSTPLDETESTDHAVVLMGLKAGRSYSFQAVTETPDGSTLTSDVSTLTVAPAPSAVGALTITVPDPAAELEDGFVLTSLIQEDGNWIVIIDRDGDIVWYMEFPARLVTSVKLPPDGRGFYTIHSDITQTEDTSQIDWYAIDGSDLTVTPARAGHHDVVMLSDRTYAFIGFEFHVFPNYGGEASDVAGDTIIEIPEGGEDGDAEVVFKLLDIYTDPQPACEHGYWSAYNTDGKDWSHSNSLMVIPGEEDAYYLMASYLDTLFKIDRDSGEILWEMQGPDTDFTPLGDHDDWSHPHMSQTYDGGFTIFDNGYHRDPSHSRVLEYSFDEGAMTATTEWIYADPEGRFNAVLGDVKKVSDDRYMTVWSQFGLLAEIDTDGEVVWQAETALGSAVGRIVWVPDLYEML